MNFAVKIKFVEKVKLYIEIPEYQLNLAYESQVMKKIYFFFLKILIFSYLTIFEKMKFMKKH